MMRSFGGARKVRATLHKQFELGKQFHDDSTAFHLLGTLTNALRETSSRHSKWTEVDSREECAKVWYDKTSAPCTDQ